MATGFGWNADIDISAIMLIIPKCSLLILNTAITSINPAILSIISYNPHRYMRDRANNTVSGEGKTFCKSTMKKRRPL